MHRFESVRLDLRYAFRRLRNRPILTATVIATLAIGVGTNAVAASLIHDIFVTPLPHPQAHQLVLVEESWDTGLGRTSWLTFEALRRRTHMFSELVAVRSRSLTVEKPSHSRRYTAMEVTTNYFSALGGEPELGRYFELDDGRQESPRVAVVSDGFWRNNLMGDAGVLGQSIVLDGQLFRVVGVAQQNFRSDPFPNADLWIPMIPVGPIYTSGAVALTAFARLKNGANLKSADSDLDIAIKAIRADDPNRRFYIGSTARVTPMKPWEMSTLASKFELLAVSIALFLIVVCLNLGNLLLASTVARTSEFDTRSAVGASPSRISQLVLAESFLLATIGSLGGVILAAFAFVGLRSLDPTLLPVGVSLKLNPFAWGYAIALAMVAAAIIGAIPAWVAVRTLGENDRQSNHHVSRSKRQQLGGRLLVISELACSLVLVCCAGLLARTFLNLEHQDLGVTLSNVVAFETSASKADYAGKQIGESYYLPLVEHLIALPGVVSAGAINRLPIATGPITDRVSSPGRIVSPSTRFALRAVMPAYFRTMSIPLIRGREFDLNDRPTNVPVAMINDVAAKLIFGTEDPTGQEVAFGPQAYPQYLIVGVFKSTNQGVHVDERLPEIDLCLMQISPNGIAYDAWVSQPITVVVQVAGAPGSVMNAIPGIAAQIDPRQPVFHLRSMRDEVFRALVQDRLALFTIGSLAVLSLILAVVGVYGVLSYSVARREREIGIRVALGASREEILKLVFWQSAEMLAYGLVIGSLGFLAASRLLRGSLYKVGLFDPTTFACVLVTILISGFAATLVPAWRASKIDPAQNLRSE